ncbi:hypothetical protein CHS0354_011824 [Potamilus streckersoni]|uniref:Uncharacterized protein n=1 Tax=Potamilus streckersoni TaxID=2493646 RepID=A0AAE0THZ6_9BIVA|nr:hypothetical protein CHS0354_011824 [Potamilus streckersoni]
MDDKEVYHLKEKSTDDQSTKGDIEGELQPLSRGDSRPSTKDTRSSHKSSTESKPGAKAQPAKSTVKSLLKPEGKSGKVKEYAEVSVQDEGGDPNTAQFQSIDVTRQPVRQSKLQPVKEGDGAEFTDAFDLSDNNAWSNIPQNQVVGRFAQYRRLTQRKIQELEEQVQLMMTKTHRKVNSLKAQFQEHKAKWEAERKVLIDQVEQAQKLQTEAEKEADAAMTQLEEFINEQEKLEEEEENKRTEITKSVSRPGTVPPLTPGGIDPAAKKSKTPEAMASVRATEGTPRGHEDGDQELRNLMQQTDDAKVQEKTSRTSGAMSAPPAVETDMHHELMKTQAEPISELEEEQHTRSAKSRASLRNQYKTKLDETRGAIEERRAKSPAISIPSQKSLDDDLLILEEEEEDDIPVADDIKEEKKLAREETLDRGTSPPPTAVKGSAPRTKSVGLVDHPIVDEFLSAYEGVVAFRNQISKLLIEKEYLTQGQVVADLEMISFDRESKVLPQLQAMTQNVYEVLQEIAATTGSILFNDQEPVVSSIAMGVSRDPTRRTMYTREQSIDSQGGGRRSIQRTPSIKQVDKQMQESLQDQYNKLKQQLEEESRKHETQMRHNTVVMMEMQDTINQLQRELSTLGKSARRPPSDMASTPGTVQTQAESGVMFTRLDSDRNAKIMKKAVMDQKLDPDKYKEVVNQMDEYVSLPAKRLAHLVRKYVHHCRMKDIEENVKKSKSLNENVFEILDKMEALQNQRAKKWADKMDEMGIERLRLANLLMETLDNIEQESGIFLIKPMYSYRGREPKPSYAGKLSRPYRPHRVISPSRESASAYAPAPTPASNIRPMLKHMQQPLEYVGNHHQQVPVRPLEGDPAGVTGSSVNWVGTLPKQTWSFSASHPRIDESMLYGNFNTPRMLELDINRMLIGQNTISARILPDYRLINNAQNLRSYMTVSRPTAPPGHVKSDHSRGFLESRDSPAPPSSPATGSFSAGVGQKRVRLALSDHESPRIPGTPPLPPIGGSKSKSPIKEPPGSPSGSSLTQSSSPLREVEIISPVK